MPTNGHPILINSRLMNLGGHPILEGIPHIVREPPPPSPPIRKVDQSGLRSQPIANRSPLEWLDSTIRRP